MTNYYNAQSAFYDATRWAFLYGRERLVETLDILPGERVLEIGCGTGANFDAIQKKLHNGGELIVPALSCRNARSIRRLGRIMVLLYIRGRRSYRFFHRR